MAVTFADLEARVRGLESRMSRTEEDVTVVVTTVSETLSRVRRLERVVDAIAAHLGVDVPAEDEEGES